MSISILDEAMHATAGDRRRDYDRASANHQRIAGVWNWYVSARPDPLAPLTPLDCAQMMILLKVARAAHHPKRDNFVDIAGYAKCASQICGFETEE